MNGIDLLALFNASPNAYVIFDPSLVIVGMNEAYLRVTNSRREDISGKPLFEAFPSDPHSEGGYMLRNSLARVLDEKVIDHLALIPYETPGPDGTRITGYWSATHTPLFDETGAVQFILQHTVDVSELHGLVDDDAGSLRTHGVLKRAQAVQSDNFALDDEARRLRQLFEQAPSFMAVLRGPEHVFELANRAYEKVVGLRSVVGMRLRDALPEIPAQGFIAILDRVRETGVPYIGRGVPVHLADETGTVVEHFLDFIYQPIRGSDGRIERIFVQGHDITEQKRAEQSLARQGEMLRLAQEAGGVGTFDFDVVNRHVTGSETFARLYGLPPSESGWDIETINARIHPDDHPLLTTVAQRPIEDTAGFTEYRVLVPGGVRWVARQGQIVRDAEGRPIHVIGAAYDITGRKEAETQREMLMAESAHRMKNMLSLVQAVTAQTLRNSASLEEAGAAVNARLSALSNAHDVLMQRNWGQAEIIDVVGGATRLLSDGEGRVAFGGQYGTLEPKAALGLALMLHELGTNAVKYGALSVPDGRVRVDWRVEQRDDGRFALLEWRESGGPPVIAPKRKGFGSRLIERGLANNLGGPVTLDYETSGLVCRAEIRVEDRERE